MLVPFWFAVAAVNFIAQIWYFFRDGSRGLYAAKRITTPMLLFGALAVLVVQRGGFSFMPGAVLLAMGLGEIGIEGSSVVESRAGTPPRPLETAMVTVAGILFLVVNLVIGIWLIREAISPANVRVGAAASIALGSASLIAATVLVVIRLRKPAAATAGQMGIYAGGIWVLLTGALYDVLLMPGISRLGLAALILSVSDTLVLIRMGAGWQKDIPGERAVLLTFLAVILLLYYLFIAVITPI
jgi:hypothetical protein